MWQLERSDTHRRKGLEAIESRDWRQGRFNLLKSAEYLLKAAKLSGPEFREIRRDQASKLLALAKQCEARLAEPVVAPVGPTGGGDGGPSATPAEKDKHLTEFRPWPSDGTKLEDVVGLDEVKRQIRLRVLYPLQHRELVAKYRTGSGGGILLYGPPGTGKTLIAKAIAGEVQAPFFAVKPSDIVAPLFGIAERNIARLFDTLRSHARAVLFLDEVDALLPTRGVASDPGAMARLVPQFLQEWQGVGSGNDDKERLLLVLGATNCPWALDPAVLRPGRFDERLFIPLPDHPARIELFNVNLAERPLGDDVNLEHLSTKSEGFSGADIKDVCDAAAEFVLEAAIERGETTPITQTHLTTALSKAKPSVRADLIAKFQEFDRG